MSRLKRATLATLVNQAFNWIGLLVSLVAIPFYLAWLGQERYGILLTGVAFASYLMFADLGLSWSAMLLIAQAKGRQDRKDIQGIVRTSFLMAAMSAFVVSVVVLGCYGFMIKTTFLMRWFPVHPEFPGMLLAVGASVVCSLIFSTFYNLLNGLQEAHLSAVYQGCGRICGTLIAMGMACAGAQLGIVFGANVLAAFLLGCLAAFHCYRRHRWAFAFGSFWDAATMRRQLRTGAKTFGIQVGNVLWGTAPILAISSAAGSQFVPLYSIPMSLLNAPLGVFNSLNSSLQPGYGEAMGKNECEWISSTVQRVFQQVIVVLGLVGCGFLLLASQFVDVWTSGKISLDQAMLCSVLMIASLTSLLGVFRFALTGVNQHQFAAISDLICGALAIGFAFLVVDRFGYQYVGLALLAAAILTSGWMLPWELRKVLGQVGRFIPSRRFFIRWAATVCVTCIFGHVVVRACYSLPTPLTILLAGASCVGVFLGMASLLLRPQIAVLGHVVRVAVRRENKNLGKQPAN